MYERFTDRARKVMQLANQEAQRFNHDWLGTEHILIGIIKEGSGVAAHVLKTLSVDLRAVRLAIEAAAGVKAAAEQVVLGKLPHTPLAKKVIEYAVEEARGLNHNYVGTEHMLLGLLRETDGLGARILAAHGLTPERVRAEVVAVLGTPEPPPAPIPGKVADTPAYAPSVLGAGPVGYCGHRLELHRVQSLAAKVVYDETGKTPLYILWEIRTLP